LKLERSFSQKCMVLFVLWHFAHICKIKIIVQCLHILCYTDTIFTYTMFTLTMFRLPKRTGINFDEWQMNFWILMIVWFKCVGWFVFYSKWQKILFFIIQLLYIQMSFLLKMIVRICYFRRFLSYSWLSLFCIKYYSPCEYIIVLFYFHIRE